MCVRDFGGSWEKYLPLVEFAYNNNYHSTIGMAPYEALYGRKYRSPSCWMEVGDRELEGPELIRETSEKVPIIQERMRTAFRGRVMLIRGDGMYSLVWVITFSLKYLL